MKAKYGPYVNFNEAMILLAEGKKMAGEDWAEFEYIYYDTESRDVLDENGQKLYANTLILNIDSQWNEVIQETK